MTMRITRTDGQTNAAAMHQRNSASALARLPFRGFLLALAALGSVLLPAIARGELPGFTPRIIDGNAGKVCYAVTVADVDGDQRDDIVVVTEDHVLWYRSPDWTRHVILKQTTLRDNVCIAAHDIDGDGLVDFALGAGWTKTGTIQWLSRGKSLDEDWKVHLISEELWTHRMRFADVLGRGRPQLVVSPLNKSSGDGVRLLAFEIPEKPRTERWPSTTLSHNLNRMHNHWHADFDRDQQIDTLTASAEGVSIIRRKADGFAQQLLPLVDGEQHAGAGEIKLGSLGQQHPFVVTIEPMHGTDVVIYEPQASGRWTKQVIENTLRRGHALWVADLDEDGADEVIVGHSDAGTGDIKGPGIYVYRRAPGGDRVWNKHVIDNGKIAVEDLVVADLTGDGKLDILACGRATHNVKLYVNDGK